MNRLGIAADEVDAFCKTLARSPHLQLEGTYTHFASAEDFTAQQTTDQELLFRGCLERMKAFGVSPGMVHMANSGAISARPETHADMVRPGAILYGHYHLSTRRKKSRKPWTGCRSSRVCLPRANHSLRDVPAGEGVGYAARFITKRPSRIAVINAGYADGVVRSRTNHGFALLHSQRVPLVGIISMDLTMLDVTDVPNAKIGDIVTIYGQDGSARIDVSYVAREIGTVTSDLLCALGRRVPKFYV